MLINENILFSFLFFFFLSLDNINLLLILCVSKVEREKRKEKKEKEKKRQKLYTLSKRPKIEKSFSCAKISFPPTQNFLVFKWDAIYTLFNWIWVFVFVDLFPLIRLLDQINLYFLVLFLHLMLLLLLWWLLLWLFHKEIFVIYGHFYCVLCTTYLIKYLKLVLSQAI